MENQNNKNLGYSNVISTIVNMFGKELSEEVISTIVDSYDGDLNASANAVIYMLNDMEQKDKLQENESVKPQIVENQDAINAQAHTSESSNICSSKLNNTRPINDLPSLSYANAFNSVAMPCNTQIPPNKQMQPNTPLQPRYKPRPPNSVLTEQTKQIILLHNQGARIIIFMRGVPGSGKTYSSKQIIEMTIGATFVDYKTHICSSDDYFINSRGQYCYDKYQIGEAHIWNQKRVQKALEQGLSPIIIDNTNTMVWEMEPYARMAVDNGYIIEIVEPNTTWARNPNQLFKRNIHNVPLYTINQMLDRYEHNVTGDSLRQYYGLRYPDGMVPPVIRVIPAYISKSDNTSLGSPNLKGSPNSLNSQIKNINISNQLEGQTSSSSSIESSIKHNLANASCSSHVNSGISEEKDNKTKGSLNDAQLDDKISAKEYMKIQKLLDIQENFKNNVSSEHEFENGENWDAESVKVCDGSNEASTSSSPKPQRTSKLSIGPSTKDNDLMSIVKESNDWSTITMFMPEWQNESNKSTNNIPINVVEKQDMGTCIEISDSDCLSAKYKILSATPRDINFYYMNFMQNKIPQQRMFDKSTMTNELMLTESKRCKNEEKHFLSFRKMFKNISKHDLRDIFDKCCGDVNWAVDIVIDGVANKEMHTLEGDNLSETEDVDADQSQCTCMAAYNIVPSLEVLPSTTEPQTEAVSRDISLVQKKNKKEKLQSDSSMQLKREMEQNFVIAENHYSNHCLKIRKRKYGSNDEPGTSGEPNINEPLQDDSDDESSDNNYDVLDKTVNFTLGKEFVTQLDELFGRKGFEYPHNFVTKVNMPMMLLNEINALWMESMMNQIEVQAEQSKVLLQQDEEFARQLGLMEAELAEAGKEPEVPDFKEIMDLELALSLYEKDVAGEWRNKEPKDLAAKMTREKLYNLFPEVPQDTLSQILMAHVNNFLATVEALLMSTGRVDVLQEKNGVNKFVFQKELERQEKFLQEQRMDLSETEWPELPKGEEVDMATVEHYRREAERHMATRNLSYKKAQEYVGRGMTQVATYYSELASFHKQKFENANSLAAASLIQVHSANSRDNSTIDLHFLRVGEAKEALDLFLDKSIQILRESHNNGGQRYLDLYLITGRGLHSAGGPRVKPAIKRRLSERHLGFRERNPGLLTTRITWESKLTFEIELI